MELQVYSLCPNDIFEICNVVRIVIWKPEEIAVAREWHSKHDNVIKKEPLLGNSS